MTLNREKLLEPAKEAGDDFFRVIENNDIDSDLERFTSLVLSAAQEEREPIAEVKNTMGFPVIEWIGCDFPIGTKLYLAPPSSNQVWNKAVEAVANAVKPWNNSRIVEAVRSLKRPLQAQEHHPVCDRKYPTLCEACNAESKPASGAVDDLPPLPAPDTHCFDEDTQRDVWSYSPEIVREYARLSRAQAAQPKTDAAGKLRAALYAIANTLDDGELRTAAREAYDASFQAQAAQQAQPVSDERESFEAWAKVKYPLAERKDSLGGYSRNLKQSAWEGWEARSLLSQSAAPSEQETVVTGRITSWIEQGKECVCEQPAAFPERDPSKPAEQQGMFRKFDVRRVDGSDAPGGKHCGCRYFVLDLNHDQHAPAAMHSYAAACKTTHPQLAAEIEDEFGEQPAAQTAVPDSGKVYGIIDPDYGRWYTIIRKLAWEEGYAIGMHGSFTRDLDMIAVPWAERHCEPGHLVRRILSATGLKEAHGNPGHKPHGRRVWTLLLPEFGDPRFIDLSIMPSVVKAHEGKASAPERCHAARDGECHHKDCPQLRDGEPKKTGRHCPLDTEGDENG